MRMCVLSHCQTVVIENTRRMTDGTEKANHSAWLQTTLNVHLHRLTAVHICPLKSLYLCPCKFDAFTMKQYYLRFAMCKKIPGLLQILSENILKHPETVLEYPLPKALAYFCSVCCCLNLKKFSSSVRTLDWYTCHGVHFVWCANPCLLWRALVSVSGYILTILVPLCRTASPQMYACP